ncbi:MAG: ABC transporter substrate-binding protein [Dehalococcoidia bacterium]|nr:ABC transporter substrate-binding protein [Dehalococcoidia bacterium]
MARKLIVSAVAMIAIIGLVVSGCTTPEPEPEPPPPPTEREGGAWVDEIVISQEGSHAAAVLKLKEGTIHVYGHGLTDPELFEAVADDPNLSYQLTLGGSRDFMFNVYGPTFDTGELNPFYSAKIREATQWLIDRDYIAEEVLGGMGVPLYTQFSPGGAESARYKDLVDGVIAYYSYNPAKGNAQIAEGMTELGAELVEGKWHYEGAPVVIHQLIRIDLRPYPELGDYFADILEEAGFTVERLYRASADTWGPFLLQAPGLGLWNVYGGGWGMPAVFRTEVHSWAQFNTHLVMAGYPSWVQLEPLMEEWPEMYDAFVRLRYTDFNTMEERAELVEIALTQVRQFANAIWSVAITDFIPHRADVGMSLDACGGVSSQFPFTIHFKDAAGNPVRGGTIHMELPSILVQPINPVEGSAMTYDIMISRDLTGDWGLLPHPQTGLNMPQRIERAEVTVKTGLPVGVSPESADWCTLSFAPEIQVPLTAWADWDAANQKFVTVAERMVYDEDYRPFANRKSVVYYPADMWDWKMHDGSTFSMGDFLMSFIMAWDRGKPDSPVFDPAEKADVETALTRWKGIEILNTDPLTVAYYSDVYALDAEHSITTFWPGYGTYGEFAGWHVIVPGWLAEMNKQLAFSASRSDELGVERADYTKGPSLPILKARLDEAKAEGFIPYAPTLGEYITAAEAAERYDNLLAWYAEKGHFYVSCGAFYLEEVFPVGKIAVLKAFDDYPFASDKWMHLVP